jgi:hypothetical protein
VIVSFAGRLIQDESIAIASITSYVFSHLQQKRIVANMKEDKYDIFSQLDREIGRDLSGWRRDIIANFEKCLLAAYEIEEGKTDEPLNLTDPTVRQAIRSHAIDLFKDDWMESEASPQKGDFISVTGESYWHTQGNENDVPTLRKLPAEYKLQGAVAYWDIQPYVDQEGLELDAHTNPQLIFRYLRPFGVQLVIDHPTLTNEAGTSLPVHHERAYLPIHYEQTELRTYGYSQ